jgi:hypothetical protein
MHVSGMGAYALLLLYMHKPGREGVAGVAHGWGHWCHPAHSTTQWGVCIPTLLYGFELFELKLLICFEFRSPGVARGVGV